MRGGRDKDGYYGRSDPPDLGRHQLRVIIDVPAIMWIITALSLFQYLATYVDIDQTVAMKGMVGVSFLIGGVGLFLSDSMGVGARLDPFMDGAELLRWITGVFISFVTIIFMNQFVARYSPLSAVALTPVSSAVFGMIIGVGEESSLRGYLQNLVENLTGSMWAGIIINSGVGATMHAAIYGSRNINVIMIVFISFIILSYVYATSTEVITGAFGQGQNVRGRRISVTMTGHALVNLTSALRGMMGG